MLDLEPYNGVIYIQVLQLFRYTDSIRTRITVEVVHPYAVVPKLEAPHVPVPGMLSLGVYAHHDKMSLEGVKYTVRLFHGYSTLYLAQPPHTIKLAIYKNSLTGKKEQCQAHI